ncbi:hypothetical protein BH09CHL1_BH09CHL1_11070 [soil metagenome]
MGSRTSDAMMSAGIQKIAGAFGFRWMRRAEIASSPIEASCLMT